MSTLTGNLLDFIFLLLPYLTMARRSGGSSCSVDHNITDSKPAREIQYTAANYFLWALFAAIVISLLLSLLGIHIVLEKRKREKERMRKKLENEQEARIILKKRSNTDFFQPSARSASRINIMKHTANANSTKIEPENDLTLYEFRPGET